MMAHKNKNINGETELRVYNMPVELRAMAEDSRTIEGYACKFNQLSRSLGWFVEKIDPEAFSEINLADQDVKALFNHDSNLILARSNQNSDTLKLEIDTTGLKFSFDAPNTTAGNDLLENIRLKNVQHCSFAFSVKVDQWEEQEGNDDIRTIIKFKELYDVSPVVDPAYLDTEVDVAKRSYDQYQADKNQPDTELTELEIEERQRAIDLRR